MNFKENYLLQISTSFTEISIPIAKGATPDSHAGLATGPPTFPPFD